MSGACTRICTTKLVWPRAVPGSDVAVRLWIAACSQIYYVPRGLHSSFLLLKGLPSHAPTCYCYLPIFWWLKGLYEAWKGVAKLYEASATGEKSPLLTLWKRILTLQPSHLPKIWFFFLTRIANRYTNLTQLNLGYTIRKGPPKIFV